MSALIVVAAIAVALLIGVAVALVVRRGSASSSDGGFTTEPGSGSAADEPPPMNGLESALAMVTDRTGRPIREAIDAEAAHVDELRVPDDTGPLLRRALDHVAHLDDVAPSAAPATGEAAPAPTDAVD